MSVSKLARLIFSILMLFAFYTVRAQQKPKAGLDTIYRKLEKAVLDTQKANLLNTLSYEHRKIDTAKARSYAAEALRLSIKESYPAGEASAYANFAESYRTSNTHDLVLEYFHKSLDIYTEIGSKKDAARVANKIGVVHHYLGDYEEALSYYRQALELNIILDEKEPLAGSYNNIGNIHYMRGEYSNALDNYITSLNIREKMGDKAGMAASYNNIGNIYSEQHKYGKALEYYLRAVQIKEEFDDKRSLSLGYSNIGALYFKMKDHKQAMTFFNRALEVSKGMAANAAIADIYANIGHLQRDEERYSEAVENYSKARNIYIEIGDKRGLAATHNALGELFIRLKNFGSAIVNLEKALRIAGEIGAKEDVKNAYGSLATAYEGKGEYKQANEYHKKFIAVKDSIYNEASNKLQAELETKYRSGKKQREIDLLKKEKEISNIKYGRNQILAYAASGGALLLLVLAIVVYMNNRQKQKVNVMLTEQNRKISRQKEEKEVLLKEVHHRVKNNLQVISSLLNLQSVHIEDPEVAMLFTDCQNRVRSMALIHEKLYTASDLSKVEIQSYVESLSNSLLRTYRLNSNITLDLQLSVKSFGVSTLIPVGLLLNELMSNSLKHAFYDEGSGVLTVKLRSLGNHTYELIVGDNGIGIPDNLVSRQVNSLGLELVHTFVEQLEGTIERLDEPGTVFRIVLRDIDAIQHKEKLEEAMA